MTTSAGGSGSAPTPLSRALDTIRMLRAQLAAREGRQPVAVIGVGLRLPGGINTVDHYWSALAQGRELIKPIPPGRATPFAAEWELLPQRGGFLDEVLAFDAEHFGISPREARALDPQHRLLLEVTAEALADAALSPSLLRENTTGLYVGITHQDYRDWEPPTADAYWATGNGHCFAAGRVAYVMGLTGPTVALDTACSSSLVAIHQAVSALRRGECDVALASGVNLILSPRSTRLLAREMGALSPDGRCRAFDARANGFVRGEGCAVLVLKPLAAAIRDRDRVHGVIHGTAVNQDGRSSGFTAPNVLAQVKLIEAALADAEIAASDIGMVEAHGTGTSLGDPIEMEALATALGRPKGPDDPLFVGAVKTNLGHLEAAAGVAGVVKAILSLKHRAVPPLVHFRDRNPRIDLAGTGIVLPGALEPWPDAAGRYAGVSSFGMSGTNAHVVLGAPETADDPKVSESVRVDGFEVSARTLPALRQLASAYAEQLRELAPADYPAFAYTATAGRSVPPHRALVSASDPASAAEALAQWVSDGASPAVTLLEAEGGSEASNLPRRVLDLPLYPWQRQPYGPLDDPPESSPGQTEGDPAGVAAGQSGPRPLYHLQWESVAAPEVSGRTVVIAGDDDSLVGALAAAADQVGISSVVLGPETAVPDRAGPLPSSRDEWTRFWRSRPDGERAHLVLAMGAHPLPTVPAEQPAHSDEIADRGAALCAAVCDAVRALDGVRVDQRVLVLTQAARPVAAGDRVAPSYHGLLHGLAPVLGLESSAFGAIVDLPSGPSAGDLCAVLRTVAMPSDEDMLAVRSGQVYAARLRPAPAEFTPELPLHPDASYLVTGGLGGVGREIVADLVRRGARHLLLLGRREEGELTDDSAQLLGRLRADGIEVAYRAVDCADPFSLGSVLEDWQGRPPLRGVIHAAGTIAHTPLVALDQAAFASALAGKFSGAWWLHHLLAGHGLDFFVLVSSVSALWGTDGYGTYAAANGGLDLIASHRAGLNLTGTSVAYGPWAVDGMADAQSREEFAKAGVDPVSPVLGCASLSARSVAADPLLVCSPVRWPRFTAVMAARRPRALFRHVAEEAGTSPPGVAGGGSGRDAVLALPERARADTVRRTVATIVARVLGYPEGSHVQEDLGFFDLGLDSMMAVDLLDQLATTYQVSLQIADVFDHPTVASLADLVLAKCLGDPPAHQEHPPPSPAGSGPVTSPSAQQAGQDAAPAALPAPIGGQYGERATAPVAIVGMAGRFPGADSVSELWRLLIDGRDGVASVPADRWDAQRLSDDDPLRTGTITTDQGGFLSDIASFDAAFFGIPAREADSIDPQHRLLLEAAWHALEDANVDPTSLRGSRTGVFVGISQSDYARVLEAGGLAGIDAYYGTGTALNAAAGRLAYLWDLRGPVMAVDTACSSSLVAIHLAMRALRAGECDIALVGGVNVIAAPVASVAVSRAHMLSPAGRCKTFADDADGFVRSEAVGVLVLKPVAAAEHDDDQILALLHGSAVNSDGASTGLTAPNGKAQQAVIAAALADAGLDGSQTSYLETHGTGTALGDPVEISAAWQVLGPGRSADQPLYLGSVKSNVGHCESAAGIVSVIKTVLALRHEQVPANLHSHPLNRRIDWASMNVRVADAPVRWPAGEQPRYAGVSGFGFSGTNAHLIIGEPPATARTVPSDDGRSQPVLLPLSASDDDGLARLTAAWDRRLSEAQEAELPALATIAASGRAHLPVRRAALGSTAEQLRRELATGAVGHRSTRPPRVAFLFSGQGSQYFGMGQDLYESEPVFRRTFDECDEILSTHLDCSLRELLWYGTDKEMLNQTRVTQPALVALELSLAALWNSWGVTADAVIGHSVGEIAAAVHAGVLDLADGLTLIVHRARLMQASTPGAMLAVNAEVERVRELLGDTALDLAAVNGPRQVVVAGAAAEVIRFADTCKERAIRTQRLAVSHAFHSRLMEPILDELGRCLRALPHRDPELPIVANVSGELAVAGQYSADYWCRHVREPVRFYEGLKRLSDQEIDTFVEIGPGRTLAALAASAGLAPPGGALTSLRRGAPARVTMREAVRALYVQGHDIRWRAVQPRRDVSPTTAPQFPFARTRHWVRTAAAASPLPVSAGPHWGRELRSSALSGRVFEFLRSSHFPAYLTDHRLYGTVVTPAASHLATILSAITPDRQPMTIRDLLCPRALVIGEDERYDVQIVIEEGQRLAVRSLVHPERGVWQEHLSGRLTNSDAALPAPPDRDEFIVAADRHLSGERFYEHFRQLGYTLGPSFRWIAEMWLSDDEALVRYARPELPDDPDDYRLYPGLIDSCFQSIAGFLVGQEDAEVAPALAIPFAAAALSFPGGAVGGDELWGHVRIRSAGDLPGGRREVQAADLHMFTADGASVMVAEDFRVRHAPRDTLRRSLRDDSAHLYVPQWQVAEQSPAPVRGEYTVRLRGGQGDFATQVMQALRERGHKVVTDGMASVDLVLDLSYLFDGDGDPQTAHGAARSLASALRDSSSGVPYAVICHEGPKAAPLRETLWGLLAAVEAEEPQRRLVRIQCAIEQPVRLAEALVDVLERGIPERRYRLVADGLQVARLSPASVEQSGSGLPDGVLITGGLGALGLSVAKLLADRGVRNLTLMGRSAPDSVAQRCLDELSERGVRVAVSLGDVAKPADCAAAVAAATNQGPLRLVLHLAGANADGAFATLPAEAFDLPFAGKVYGAWELVTAVRGQELSGFVLFSSVASVLGSAGQANYAAANGYLNGLAMALRAEGVPATSICWGPWEPAVKPGMAGTQAARDAAARVGVGVLGDADAGPVLESVLDAATAQVVAVAVDALRYRGAVGSARASLLAGLGASPQAPTSSAGSEDPGRAPGWLRDDLIDLDPMARDEQMRQVIGALVAKALGSPGDVDEDRGFADLGMDSIMAIDLRAGLGQALGVDLPATVALDHPTVAALASFVNRQVFRGGGAPEHGPAAGDNGGHVGCGHRPGGDVGAVTSPGVDGRSTLLAREVDQDELTTLSLDELVSEVKADLTTDL